MDVDAYGEASGRESLAAMTEAPSGTKLDYLVNHFEQSVGPVKAVLPMAPAWVSLIPAKTFAPLSRPSASATSGRSGPTSASTGTSSGGV